MTGLRALVCTDDRTFSPGLADAYRARGYDVVHAVAPLSDPEAHFDLIHLHWPEELLGWKLPAPAATIDRVLATLDRRRTDTRLVCTVHNLLPHTLPRGDTTTVGFYEAFYARMTTIGHFSQHSRDAVVHRFPTVPVERHRVHGMNSFDHLLPLATGRDAARQALGVAADEILVATLGLLRSRAEAFLLMRAVARLKLPRLRIIHAARRAKGGNRVRRWVEDRWSDLWARRYRVDVRADRQSDAEMVALLEAADVLLVPRLADQLNSGLLPLAMTFGTPLVAPDQGVFREMLGGSSNGLYPPGDARSMTAATDGVARNVAGTRAANLAMASSWGWTHALGELLDG